MRTIITFLNDKGLKAGTVYTWQGREYEGGVFSLALRQFVAHDRMLVCNTPEAEKNTWPALAALDDPRIKPVSIPKGETTTEMWKIFECIEEQIETGETVIFDITHGLRSLPFLTFLFAAYLKTAKDVKIEAIYYGALELGKPAPVIDLSEFVVMLDWLTATNRFIETGDGYPLANLLRAAQLPHPPHMIHKDQERDLDTHNRSLRQTASDIEDVSHALLSNLAPHAQKKSHILLTHLVDTEKALMMQLPPYRVLAEQVRQSYIPLAYATPFSNDLFKDLQTQLHMITWYIERGRVPQAVTLMREWCITAVGYRLGWTAEQILPYQEARHPIELLLNHKTEEVNVQLKCAFDTLTGVAEIVQFWGRLGDWRNFIDHAAHRPHWEQKSAKLVVGKVKQFYHELLDIALHFIPELSQATKEMS